MLLTDKIIDKISINPLVMEKEIKKVLSSENKEDIIYLFKKIDSSKFYDYLINNDLIIYFSTNEIVPLLNNNCFINYLFTISPEVFNSISIENYTKELITFMEKNIESLVNTSFDIFTNPILVNDKVIIHRIIDYAKNSNDFISLLNTITSDELINDVITKVKSIGIKLDIELLNENLLNNISIARYAVFDCDLDNIKYFKGEAYKKVYTEILSKIKTKEISFKDYNLDNFPMDLRTRAVLDALTYNIDNYHLIPLFEEPLSDSFMDFRIYLNSDNEKRKIIFNNNKDDINFFKLYVANIDDLSFEYLYDFDYLKMAKEPVLYLLNSYNNKKIREFLLNLKNTDIIGVDEIYKYILKNEKNVEYLRLLLKNINAFEMSYESYDLMFNLIDTSIIEDSYLNESFFLCNKFLNYIVEKNRLNIFYRFKPNAFKITNKFENKNDAINNINKSNDDMLYLYILQYMNKDNISINNQKQLEKKIIDNLKTKMTVKDASILLYLFENDKRNIYSFRYLNDEKEILSIINYGDILNNETSNFIKSINTVQLKMLNIKHIRTIINMIEKLPDSKANSLSLAIKMYLTIGFNSSIDLLNNKYGAINISKLRNIFLKININSVSFIQEAKEYSPIINEELNQIIFANSYKIETSPIKLFLNDCQNANVSINYKNNLNYFFNNNFNECINNWELIKEEYIRKKYNSSLETRLNIECLNEICNYIKNTSRISYEQADLKLKNSDVFKYAGLDNQYVLNYKDVPQRIIALSRNMENNKNKFFPNIKFSKDNYTLSTLNPDDRNILSLGYKLHNCFRPLGVADNYGVSKSLFEYACTNSYGGVIEIRDVNNKIISFSPIYRHGNVLLINSVEGYDLKEEEKIIINSLYRKYAHEVIENAKKSDDKIDFIMITLDNDNLILNLEDVEVDYEHLFNIKDSKCEYLDANLYQKQYIIAGNKDLDDINYNIQEKEYEYPSINDAKNINLNQEQLESFNSLIKIKNKIIALSNSIFDKDDNHKYEIIKQINKLKKDYFLEYKLIVDNDLLDQFDDYVTLINLIKRISNKEILNIYSAYYENNYYIVKTFDNKLYYDSDNQINMKSMVEKFKKEEINEDDRCNKRNK